MNFDGLFQPLVCLAWHQNDLFDIKIKSNEGKQIIRITANQFDGIVSKSRFGCIKIDGRKVAD